MKMKLQILTFLFALTATLTYSQIEDPKATEVWEPVPRMVDPGNSTTPPSDAVVLFDGRSLDNWQHSNGQPNGWKLEKGVMTVVKGKGDIFSKQKFGDCQLHLEFRIPTEVEGEGQDNGNSGVYLQEKYEIQVLGSYDSKTYSNGQCGALYKQQIPLVNASRPKMEWQTYDIIFKAPVFNKDGIRVSPGYITVLHNGVLVQNHVQIQGTTEYIGLPKNIAHGKGSIVLQDHGNPVSYRNIWIREL